jgi:hypothetical protein
VPAAAVIPAPIAYIKVVAVKKLVVGSQFKPWGLIVMSYSICAEHFTELSHDALHRVSCGISTFTLKKLECSKQALSPNNLAWNN